MKTKKARRGKANIHPIVLPDLAKELLMIGVTARRKHENRDDERGFDFLSEGQVVGWTAIVDYIKKHFKRQNTSVRGGTPTYHESTGSAGGGK